MVVIIIVIGYPQLKLWLLLKLNVTSRIDRSSFQVTFRRWSCGFVSRTRGTIIGGEMTDDYQLSMVDVRTLRLDVDTENDDNIEHGSGDRENTLVKNTIPSRLYPDLTSRREPQLIESPESKASTATESNAEVQQPEGGDPLGDILDELVQRTVNLRVSVADGSRSVSVTPPELPSYANVRTPVHHDLRPPSAFERHEQQELNEQLLDDAITDARSFVSAHQILRPVGSGNREKELFEEYLIETVRGRDDMESTSFAPKPFRGGLCEDVDAFIAQLDKYVEFKSLTPEKALSMLKFLLQEAANDWLQTQAGRQISSYALLKAQLRERYGRSEIVKHKTAKELFNRRQRPDEDAESYISAMTKLGRSLNRMDDTMAMYAIMGGLKPSLATFVAQKQPKTLQELTEYARLGELTTTAAVDPPSAVIAAATSSNDDKWQLVLDELRNLRVAAVSATPRAEPQTHRDERRQYRPSFRGRQPANYRGQQQFRPQYQQQRQQYNYRAGGRSGQPYAQPYAHQQQQHFAARPVPQQPEGGRATAASNASNIRCYHCNVLGHRVARCPELGRGGPRVNY